MLSKTLAGIVTWYIVTACGQTIDLGTAATYAVVGATTITNAGLSVVDGDIAIYPGSFTGFLPGDVAGTESVGDPVAEAVQADTAIAFAQAATVPCGTNLTGKDLGGQVLGSGVYCFSSFATLTGNLTLDGQGNPSANFVFQVGFTLATVTATQVLVINSAQSYGVYWALGSSASLVSRDRQSKSEYRLFGKDN